MLAVAFLPRIFEYVCGGIACLVMYLQVAGLFVYHDHDNECRATFSVFTLPLYARALEYACSLMYTYMYVCLPVIVAGYRTHQIIHMRLVKSKLLGRTGYSWFKVKTQRDQTTKVDGF